MKTGITKSCLFLLVVLAGSAFTINVSANGRVSQQAAIAISDKFGARVAEDILNAGGNAVDASVATGFALAVTYIEAGNIGGGGFMLIYMNGEPFFLDYRETAPLAADRDMYLDESGNVIEKSSLIGARAVGVPGTVAGFWAAHQRFGKLPWKDVVAPAIELARAGFIPGRALADDIKAHFDWFGASTNFKQHFGNVKAGEIFRQPELAETLERIAEEGANDFYLGKTAALLLAQMLSSGGLISAMDLRNYKVIWRRPLRADWRGYEIFSAPPPSSGGFGVIQLLKMKDYLADEFAGLTHNSSQYVHLVAEMEKRLFADRAAYLGDPAFIDIDMPRLISDAYIRTRAAEVDPKNISLLDHVAPGLESPNTTHFSILDADGNAVSNTYTLNWSYGAGIVVEDTGFLLNNEMDDFSVKPGIPNIYGVVGNKANEIQPGKRMLSSMSPTILLKNCKVSMVIGTPGGSTIFTSIFQTIVNILDFDMSPLEAVGATRFHHQLLPPDLITQSPSRPLPASTISELEQRGYRVEPHSWEFGNVQVIWVTDDSIIPASDPRYRGVSRLLDIETATVN